MLFARSFADSGSTVAAIGRPLSWEDRISNYERETGFPRAMFVCSTGSVVGVWVLGQDYRSKSGYHGAYPPNYLLRIKALFPEKKRALHVFSGMVDLEAFPGDTVDLNPTLNPTFVDDAQTLESVPLEEYDIVLADPPYTEEDANRYGVTMVARNRVMRALSRARPGTHVCWLDMTLPMYRKDTWSVEADIGVRRSTNHRFRHVTIFCRK